MLLFPVFLLLQVAVHHRPVAAARSRGGHVPRREAPGRGRPQHRLLGHADHLRADDDARRSSASWRCCRRWRRTSAPTRTSSTTTRGPTRRSGWSPSVYAAGTFVCGLSVFLAYEDSFSELPLSMDTVIVAEQVSKRFDIHHNRAYSLKARMLGVGLPAVPAAGRGLLGAARRVAADRPRRGGRPGRAQRLGQEHAAEADRRHPPADLGPRAGASAAPRSAR